MLPDSIRASLSDRKECVLFSRFTNILGLMLAFSLNACSSPPSRMAPRQGLKLEMIRHDWQTTYVYREVNDSSDAISKH
jgi:hypothetical protein